MPELKNTFTGGKMEKDLDERIVPSGQYREALNISVATSEDSDVGAAQNILGNIKVTEAIQSRTMTMGEEYAKEGINNDEPANFHVAEVIDPLTDMLYRFIHTASVKQGIWMDRIIEFDTQATLDTLWHDKESAVMVDIFKVTDTIDTHHYICSDSNKSKISILSNINQVRWGMKVVGPDLEDPNPNWADGDVTVEEVDYINGWITLNKAIYGGVNGAGDGQPVTFYGDRNLSFGDTNNIKNITGINIIDGMIFWTDNFSEPKKVNIERSKEGCNSGRWSAKGAYYPQGNTKIDDFNQHTILVVDDRNPQDCMKDDLNCPPGPSWDCDGQGNCYDPGTGNGLYATLGACQNNCTAVAASWDCINGACIDPGTGNGAYSSLSACQATCGVAMCSPVGEKFEERLILMGYDTGIADNQVPVANVNTITNLDLQWAPQNPPVDRIDDLTGIECFTMLEDLDVRDNDLLSIDLSNNLAITHVDCADQDDGTGVGGLTNLDVQSNNALSFLRCSNNELQNLDLVNNVNLIELLCSGNNLSGLGLSQNTLLQRLTCGLNPLNTLDVTNNPDLYYLSAGAADLTTIDLSQNPLLESVYLSGNNITDLDISNNTGFANSSSSILTASDNDLINLDLPTTNGLKKLRIANNQLTEAKVSGLSNLVSLREISCQNNNFQELDLDGFVNLSAPSSNINSNPGLHAMNNPGLARIYLTNIDAQTELDNMILNVNGCHSSLKIEVDNPGYFQVNGAPQGWTDMNGNSGTNFGAGIIV